MDHPTAKDFVVWLTQHLVWHKVFFCVFKYLRDTLTNQNSIQEEIKSRLKQGNACYRSVQNLLSASLLS
jgi:hypothetical protein